MAELAQVDYAAPLSLVDEVLCCEPQRIVTRCLLRASEPVFAGHYPHDPVFPGVLMVEAVVQACRVWAERHATRLRLRELASIRFLAALRPGDCFELCCELSEPDADEGVRVDARIVALGEGESVVACVCRLRMQGRDTTRLSDAGIGPRGRAQGRDGLRHGLLDHVEVRRVLPQRYPFILLDAVDEISDDGGVIARKAITCSEPCYASVNSEDIEAFAYPLSLLMESFSHSVSIILERGWGEKLRSPEYVVLFGSMRRFRFHGAAYPGDTLIHHGRVDWMNSESAVVSGRTMVGDRVIASVERITAFVKPVAPRTGAG